MEGVLCIPQNEVVQQKIYSFGFSHSQNMPNFEAFYQA